VDRPSELLLAELLLAVDPAVVDPAVLGEVVPDPDVSLVLELSPAELGTVSFTLESVSRVVVVSVDDRLVLSRAAPLSRVDPASRVVVVVEVSFFVSE
jgi:hypothetical protein